MIYQTDYVPFCTMVYCVLYLFDFICSYICLFFCFFFSWNSNIKNTSIIEFSTFFLLDGIWPNGPERAKVRGLNWSLWNNNEDIYTCIIISYVYIPLLPLLFSFFLFIHIFVYVIIIKSFGLLLFNQNLFKLLINECISRSINICSLITILYVYVYIAHKIDVLKNINKNVQ